MVCVCVRGGREGGMGVQGGLYYFFFFFCLKLSLNSDAAPNYKYMFGPHRETSLCVRTHTYNHEKNSTSCATILIEPAHD